MKKRCLLIAVALVVVFGTVCFASASVDSATVTVNRTSNTSCTATARAGFDGPKSFCSCTMTLQEKYSGGWRTATGVSKKTAYNSKTNTISILLSSKFTLIKGKVYRIKARFVDKNGSTSTSSNYYSSTF